MKRRKLINKLISFFIILVVSVLFMAGLSTYANQSAIYRNECETNLQNIVDYFSVLMRADGQEFVAYQKLFMEVSEDVLIPIDWDGDYHPAKTEFYQAFQEVYPSTSIINIDYMNMPHDLKVLYVKYKHEYWLHIFEEARFSFDIPYTYYVVPTGEELHMYYMIDCVRDPKEVNGLEYILLNLDIEQPMETHEHMWTAWETGEYTPGFDITDNEFGVNCAYFYPLVIDGEKLGVIGSDISFDTVNSDILKNTMQHIATMGILIIIICGILILFVGRDYVSRLIKIKEFVSEYTEHKDPAVADKMMAEIKMNDEITDLSNQVAIMIKELDEHNRVLFEKNKEIIEAQEKIKSANEAATRDSLTGIRNKKAYDDEVKRIEYKIETEDFKEFGIAMVDLNFLKYINDNFGHEKGNIAIKRICQIICVNFAHSPVFRVGGDEFVVILMNSDYKEAKSLVEKFKDTVAEIYADNILEPWERVSAAIGWTLFDPSIDEGVQNVFKRADDLMYENKKEMKATRD